LEPATVRHIWSPVVKATLGYYTQPDAKHCLPLTSNDGAILWCLMPPRTHDSTREVL